MRFLGFLVVLSLTIISLYLQFSGNPLSKYPLALACITTFILWILKGIELGVESVRGQFYVILGTGFLFQGLAFFFADFSKVVNFEIFGLIFMTLGRFFFFAANARYIWFFQTSGYYLTFARLMILLVAFSLIFTSTFFVPNLQDHFLKVSPLVSFIILDWGMVFIVLYNLLLLWDTEIGKRWAIGSIVIFSFLFADALFVAGFPSNFPFTLWTVASFLMALISLIRG
ncbi:hypothetical protein LM594_01350 [Candidatus Caldipriscus sp.]|nr:hypothetical protein [Candidatus Caldipriscus sp.]